MFRAIHKEDEQPLYILGDQATQLRKLAQLARKGLLVCEICWEPLQIVRESHGIWIFYHHPPRLSSPYCRLRFKSLRDLLHLQVGTDFGLRTYPEIELIETNEYFVIPDEVRRYVKAASSRVRHHLEPGYLILCELCNEVKGRWEMQDVYGKLGKCNECMKHD